MNEEERTTTERPAPTPGPWIKARPGGPSGPFWSLVNGKGNVVAMQIPQEEDAILIAAAPAAAALLAELEQNAWIPVRYHRMIRDWQREAGLRADTEDTQ